MRRIVLPLFLAFAVTSLPAHAADGDMSVAEFLTKAERLKARGLAAMFSSDIKLLKREVEASASQYRARIVRDREAGRTPHSCPPEGEASLDSDTLLGHLRGYPEARRPNITMRTAFADLMAQRYPCG